ncbi:DUF2785 domain-containing protein [Parvularcula sp. IMCC14364]|uniref:DUF2785 domain-containing protein n=1 Tax=Parvularcula sp. IMCC14364 TaxID=3067902 RepID=UPI002741A97E|nr:DUF2785 domain-containing protein [Parvularcula sp. IMCC14364]
MKKYLASITLAACTFSPAMATEAPACSPLGMDKTSVMALREAEFTLENEAKYQTLAMDLIACLGHPDPDLRDKIGYEGLSKLMREKRISAAQIVDVGKTLIEKINEPDTDGFLRPFAALVLSEVARADRIDDILTAGQRQVLIDEATAYISDITDYRGFDEDEGWRHGVAHGADLLMQLTLNDALDRKQILQIRDTIGAQIMASNEHFYLYGEPERLARPILFAARRGLITETEWTAWFETITAPAPFDSWGDVFFSQEGLAKRHNLRGFAMAIYVNADVSSNENYKVLLSGALATLGQTN